MANHRVLSQLLAVLTCTAWCHLILAQDIAHGPYLGQVPPGIEAQMFAPGIVSLANRNEYGGSFTPDGQEFYFTVSGYRVMMTHQHEGTWTAPVLATFSGQSIDWGVYPSPDGQRLFFGSSRPQQSWAEFNVWMCERQGLAWSDPVKLALNSSGLDYAGTCTWDGTHYFGSQRQGLISIFRSVPVAGEYTQVEKLPHPINTGGRDLGPCIAPDESYLIFASDREANQDLYISYRDEDDSWTEPINLGPSVNSQDSEWNPSLSPDGQYLFFSRSTGEPTGNPQNFDLYWIHTKAFLPDSNGPILNLSSEERYSSIRLAVHFAAAGETIVIEPGIYHESIVVDKDVTLQSLDPNDPYYVGGTIIQADLDDPVVTLNGNTMACTLAGLTLRAGSVGIMGTSTHATFRNCRIMDNATHGLELFDGSEPTLDHCLITANNQAGIMMHAGQGRRASYCKPRLNRCHIVDNGEGSLIDGQPVIVDSVIEGQ